MSPRRVFLFQEPSSLSLLPGGCRDKQLFSTIPFCCDVLIHLRLIEIEPADHGQTPQKQRAKINISFYMLFMVDILATPMKSGLTLALPSIKAEEYSLLSYISQMKDV